MGSQIHQRLLLIAIFSVLIFSNENSDFVQNVAAHIHLSPATAPNLQPVASPSSGHDKLSPSPTSVPPVSHVSLPPSGAEPPSVMESPDGESQSTSLFSTSQLNSQGDGISLSSSELQLEGHFNFNFDNFPGKLPEVTDCDPEVKNICESTDYPSLCLSAVVPFLNGKTDVISILGTAIKVANGYAKFALTMLNRFTLAPGIPEKVVAALNDCKDSYEDVLYNFENAVSALPAHDIGTMNTMLSAAITACGDCEDGFKELNFPCPITGVAEKLINMTSNCLAISSLSVLRT